MLCSFCFKKKENGSLQEIVTTGKRISFNFDLQRRCFLLLLLTSRLWSSPGPFYADDDCAQIQFFQKPPGRRSQWFANFLMAYQWLCQWLANLSMVYVRLHLPRRPTFFFLMARNELGLDQLFRNLPVALISPVVGGILHQL